MPLDFLTQAERQRCQLLPVAIPERDMRQYFHLSEADRAFVATFRGATSRLGVALHLGLLRYLGYLPDAWAGKVPAELRAFVAGQLADGPPADLAEYGSREATRTAHLQAALQHLGWSKWTPLEQGWLPQMAALLASGHESYVDEAAGRLVVPRLQAEELSASVTALQAEMTCRLPRVELTDLLVEVDGWTQFSAHL